MVTEEGQTKLPKSIVIPLHLSQLRNALPEIIEDADAHLSEFGRNLVAKLGEALRDLDERIEAADDQIQWLYRSNALCQRISAIEGVGPLSPPLQMAVHSRTAASSRLGWPRASSTLQRR